MEFSFRRLLTCLLTLLSGLLCLPAVATSPLDRDGMGAARFMPEESALTARVAVLVDESGKESIASVASAPEERFVSLSRPFSAGYTRKVHWLRVTLERGAPVPPRWLLQIGPGYLDDVRLYTPAAGTANGFRERASGDRLPFAAREVAHRLFVFPIDLPDDAAPYTIYVRLRTTSTSMAHLSFYEPDAFVESVQTEYLGLGMRLGCLGLMLLYSLACWRFLRERYLLLFVCLVVSIGIALLGTSGLAEQIAFPEHPQWANLFAPVGLCLFSFFVLWFFLDFFKAWRPYPWFSRLCIVTMALAALAVPGVVFDYYVEIAPVLMVFLLTCLPFYLVVGWRSIGRDIIGGRWVALAHAWYCVIIGINLLAVLGIAPGYAWIYDWQFNTLIYFIFLISGVSMRVCETERLRDQAVASSIAAEMKAEVADARREEKGKFLSLMAHELKTPLATIDAAVQALGYAHSPADPAISRRHQRIRDAVARLNTLLEDSLNVVRNETDKSNPMAGRELIVMTELSGMLGTAYSAHLARLRFDFEPIDDGYGNAMLLRLALGNLLDNALKYGKAGGAIVASACRRTYLGYPGVAFEVSNAFTGTADEDCEAWFGKYWRGKNSAGKEGLGLGLYLVRSIAEAHGGVAHCSVVRTDAVANPALVATLWIPIRVGERM